MKRILISGGTGFLGRALKAELEKQGHLVNITSRKFSKHTIHLDFENAPKDLRPFEGYDCWIHLAGENIEALRWTSKKRRKILFSRLTSGETVREIIKNLKHPPTQIFVASGAGFYGYNSKQIHDESSPRGKGFLAFVAEEVENSWKGFFIEPIFMRIAPVFSFDGGILKKLSNLWKMRFLLYFGNPNNYFPYVKIEELIRMIAFMFDKKISGPINIVSLVPKKQKDLFLEFMQGKPIVTMTLPKQILEFVGGDFAKETALVDMQIIPKVLSEMGYRGS